MEYKFRAWDGKQAYYGDIVLYSNTEGKLFQGELIWVEELCCLYIGVMMPYHKLYDSAYIQPSKLQFEILGNIHQNPELKQYQGYISR